MKLKKDRGGQLEIVKMSQFKISLATNDDDSKLREILRKNPMRGSISLVSTKEPCFFNSISVEGKKNYVISARNLETNLLVGFGIRSVKPVFINGNVKNIAYLSGLRLDKQFRGRSLVYRGYKFLYDLDKENPLPYSLTSIIDDNQIAKNILASSRKGIPLYEDLGVFYTHVIPVLKNKINYKNSSIITGENVSIEQIVEFLHKEGSKKQFYPYYLKEDFDKNSGLLRGLNLKDINVYLSNGEIMGLMGSWNQSSFKQTIIDSYNPLMKLARPVINSIFRIKGFLTPLPKEGEKLNYSCGAIIAIKDNDSKIFTSLIDSCLHNLAQNNIPLFMVGLHSLDSLNDLAKKYNLINFKTRIYNVSWNQENRTKDLDGRVPYLELGSL